MQSIRGDVATATFEVETLKDTVALRLVDRLRRHHAPTYSHSTRVARLAEQLGASMGRSPAAVRRLRRGALLHDIGKLEMSVRILDKPAPLTDAEWACMDQHSDLGARLVRRTHVLSDEAYLVEHHHRWYAGNNPLGAAYCPDRDGAIDVIAVCDAYDAMVSERPYSSARDRGRALAELRSCAGDQFSPEVVAAFAVLVAGPPLIS